MKPTARKSRTCSLETKKSQPYQHGKESVA